MRIVFQQQLHQCRSAYKCQAEAAKKFLVFVKRTYGRRPCSVLRGLSHRKNYIGFSIFKDISTVFKIVFIFDKL